MVLIYCMMNRKQVEKEAQSDTGRLLFVYVFLIVVVFCMLILLCSEPLKIHDLFFSCFRTIHRTHIKLLVLFIFIANFLVVLIFVPSDKCKFSCNKLFSGKLSTNLFITSAVSAKFHAFSLTEQVYFVPLSQMKN